MSDVRQAIVEFRFSIRKDQHILDDGEFATSNLTEPTNGCTL